MWPTHWMLPNNYEGPSMRKSYSTPRIIKLYSAFEPQKIKKSSTTFVGSTYK